MQVNLTFGRFCMHVQTAAICFGLLNLPVVVAADDGVEFFENKIRPVLVEHCYECHSGQSRDVQGELRLDLRAGWQVGGASGDPAVIPGNPDESPLIRAVRHDDDVSPMPPEQSPLSAEIVADLAAWVRSGAPDPRDGHIEPTDVAADWEAKYQHRLDWWSLQPVKQATPPSVKDERWVRTNLDRFILAKLEANSLAPAREAQPLQLVRLSLVLTGLPPDAELTAQFTADGSDQAWSRFVDSLLDSPHFGERWARHWMDVVHYADTHGYEWDVPAKNAWRYRDYLIRAFNADVPYRRLLLEQIAGDLIEPRIDQKSGLIETLIAPMALRLGERRHGDNADHEGVTQEAVANVIDTVGKAFLGTTLACARCHDHKLDAVEQRDFYALAGILMSTRFSTRSVDAFDPNESVIAALAGIKRQLRDELARIWLERSTPGGSADIAEKIRALPTGKQPAAGFPATITEFWLRSRTSPVTTAEFLKERESRIARNQKHVTLVADFAKEDTVDGWAWDGFGMKHGRVENGELVIADEGDRAVMSVLPAGRFSHVWSQRLPGLLQSPQFDTDSPLTFSIRTSGGRFASRSFIVDRALHSERSEFINQPSPAWITLTAGNFSTVEGTPDTAERRVYLELATKSFNNYFPPRVSYKGVPETEIEDERSWFGVTQVSRHAPGQEPQDELDRFLPLFEGPDRESDPASELARLVHNSVDRWSNGISTRDDVRLLNDALEIGLLPNDISMSAAVARLVELYRIVERDLRPDRTVGSAADWHEARDERLAVRGSYTRLGGRVARGGPRFLTSLRPVGKSSGRLALARSIADPQNPLTARVYVNRVWHYLLGEGLVRTPDDFGHLGELPDHPELLDSLATQFISNDWSTKDLIRLIVSSSVWRQDSVPDAAAHAVDPENRLWHHVPMRRLDAEAIRDSMLSVSGRLDASLFGPPIEPFRTAEDPMKRLFRGPVDGKGRRSVYLEMTLMEPPRFLALFNQPIPKQTVGRRGNTNVPDQALALLNDPFVIAMAEYWSRRLIAEGAPTAEHRAENMLRAAPARPPDPAEITRLVKLAQNSAVLRGGNSEDLLDCRPAWQDAAHAVFNLKEFIHVP